MGSSETNRALAESLARSAVLRAHQEQCTVPGCGECARLDAAVVAVWAEWRAVRLDFRAPPGQDALF